MVLKPVPYQEDQMPVPPHHTDSRPAGQLPALLTDSWATEVVPQLPADLDTQAQRLGAFQRQRGLTCSTDLLRALLAYVLCATSFRLLGAWAVLLGLADLSEAAWRKRLRRANAWLLWLLTEVCVAPVATPPPGAQGSVAADRRILLVDATMLGTPGGNGDEWRLHTAYDFTAGRLSEVVLGDRHSGEQLDHYALQAGDIVVADSGYGYRRNLVTARNARADVVLRISHCGFPLETITGAPLDIAAWVQRGRGSSRHCHAVCQVDRQRLRVRLLALRLPPAAAQQARHRALRRAQDARARAQRLQRRAELVGERLRAGERILRDRQRRGQLAQGRAQRGILARQAREHGVGIGHEVRDLVVLLAELAREQREVVDRALDVGPALGQRLVDPP